MAPKKSSIILNVDQFIHDVEERPAIWNRNFHCNKAFLEQMWDELSSEHKLPKVVLKAKWKGLRDNFRVEYKRIPRAENGDFLVEPATFDSKWIHYYALLFLTEHMRHRMPKQEPDQSYYFQQQSQDCEKTVVEPDLTNGLIRRIQDSDEEFDEDDVDDDDDEQQQHQQQQQQQLGTQNTPPLAHSNTSLTSFKTEESRALFKSFGAGVGHMAHTLAAIEDDDDDGGAKEAQDLSKKSIEAARAAAKAALALATAAATAATASAAATASSSVNANAAGSSVTMAAALNLPPYSHTTASTPLSVSSASTTSTNSIATQPPHKKRSVSPPPLYNKAHHPLPQAACGTNAALNKERDEFNVNGGGNCLHGSHEHLNFTKHSYANGLIPALKLKRPRLSEDSNFNGSSTMDNSVPLVPEDDDYHYLLSLHPYMKQLTAAQKLRIRTKIQKLIFKELYKEDLEEIK